MKCSTLVPHVPHNVDEAIAVRAEFGHEARVLGGGRSPIPILNMIAALSAAFADQALVDLLPCREASGVAGGEVRTLDRVGDWEQTPSQGLVIRFEEHDSVVVAGEGALE